MINRRSAGIASLHTLLLAIEAVGLWFLVAWAVTSLRSREFTTLLPLPAYPIAIALSLTFSIGAVARADASMVIPSWTESMRLAFRQILAITCAVFTLSVGMKDPGISRIFLASYLPVTGLSFIFINRFQPGWLVRLIYGRESRLRTLIVGRTEHFPGFETWLTVRCKFGLEPVGVISYRGMAPDIFGLEVVGEFSKLKEAIHATGARQVLTLNLPHSSEDAEHLARVCASCGCRLLIHNNVTFRLTYPLRVMTQDGYTFLAFQDEPLEDPLNRGLKRGLDIMVSLPAVLFVLPVLSLVVWAIQRWQSPGALFYRQRRSGMAGRHFHILKFRTMHVTGHDGTDQTAPDDHRVFRFGRFLRRASLDELPQFWNVLTGEMSVVGPRPHFVEHDELFADAVNEYRVRFFVKPGITGLAQSRGVRGQMQNPEAVHKRLELDLLYIHSWSMWLDCAIIARTILQVVFPPPGAR